MILRRHLLALAAALVPHRAQAKRDLPRVDPATIVAKYGPPDRIVTTEHDKPRPPIVSKFLDYSKARVRFALVADAPLGSPPPHKHWLLVGIQDPTTKRPLSADEVTKRLGSRTPTK